MLTCSGSLPYQYDERLQKQKTYDEDGSLYYLFEAGCFLHAKFQFMCGLLNI